MHPGMTPSHPGAATPARDSAWAPVMATPRHPSSDGPRRVSAWDPVPGPEPSMPGNGRSSGWDQGPAAYSAPVTSVPLRGAAQRSLTPSALLTTLAASTKAAGLGHPLPHLLL